MKSTLALLLAFTTMSVACNSSSPPSGPTSVTPQSPAASSPSNPASTSSSASPISSPVAGLVGRWERVVTCQELVSELDKAGLGPLAQYAWLGQTSSTGQTSFAPGSPKPTAAHPCTGALPRTHSHFFNQSDQFGSLDWLGGQVDDGPYRIVNSNTIRIGGPTGADFHYRIAQGETLMLTPVLTKAMIRRALADPKKFSAAGWAVSVAYSAHPWKRVPCQGWC